MPKGNFPPGVVVKVNEKGSLTDSIMIEWIQEVWLHRENMCSAASRAFLIMDSSGAHATPKVLSELKPFPECAIVPHVLIPFCQPFDAGVSESFRGNLRMLWES